MTIPTQQLLPLMRTETRAAQLQRLLSGELGDVVKPPIKVTFTEEAMIAATAKATTASKPYAPRTSIASPDVSEVAST